MFSLTLNQPFSPDDLGDLMRNFLGGMTKREKTSRVKVMLAEWLVLDFLLGVCVAK